MSNAEDEKLRMDWLKGAQCVEETTDRVENTSGATIRYEVEAKIRFKGEIYTGREIWTAHVHAGPLAASTGGMQVEDKGEAISIDLPDGRTIYLLRRLATSTGEMLGGSGGDLGFFRHCLDEVSTPQEQVRKSREFRGTCVVPLRLLMVTFSDPSDPETLSILNKDEQLSGSEVEFVELRVIKPPRAEANSSIVDELPWLAGMDYNDEVLEGGVPDHFSGMSPDLLYATDFIRR
jgi:hypothetical protein